MYGVFLYLSHMSTRNTLGWIVAAALAVLLFLSVRSCRKNKDDRDELANMITAANDSTHHWQNKYGEEVATRMVVEGSLKNMKSFLTKDDIKELEDRFKLDIKNLKSYIAVNSKGDVYLPPVGEPVIVYRDSAGQPCPVVRYMAQAFGGPWDSVYARIGDSAYARVQSWDTVRLVTNRKRTGGLFNRKWHTEVSVQNANPHVRNTIAGAFLVSETYEKSSLDVLARGGYRYFKADAAASNLYGGLELQWNLGRTAVSGSYNKLLGGTGRYFVEGGIKYRLIRF